MLLRLLRRLVLMVVWPLLQFCSKAFGDYAARSEVIDILDGREGVLNDRDLRRADRVLAICVVAVQA